MEAEMYRSFLKEETQCYVSGAYFHGVGPAVPASSCHSGLPHTSMPELLLLWDKLNTAAVLLKKIKLQE